MTSVRARRPGRLSGTPAGAVLVVVLVAVVDVLNVRVTSVTYLITRQIEMLALCGAAVWWGLRPADLGISPSALRRGVRPAALVVALVLLAYTLALLVPATRARLAESATVTAAGAVVVDAAIRVLIGTALLEELAFRGVLWGIVDRLSGPRAATVWSAALFGLWHIAPSTLGGAAWTWPAVAMTVAYTAGAGIVFGWLRQRTGSLLPPIALHWALNGLLIVYGAVALALGG